MHLTKSFKGVGSIDSIKVKSPKDCGNSPKKRFINEHIIALARNDIGMLETTFTNNSNWILVGQESATGKKEVLEAILDRFNGEIAEIEVQQIITHGSTAAAHGSFKTAEGSEFSFCHLYQFVSAGKNVIKEMTTYLIMTNRLGAYNEGV